MGRIYLVGTVHEDVGNANVAGLQLILESIRPDVAFVEVPRASFEDYYVRCSRYNVESLAIRMYRETYRLDVIPVDRTTPGQAFFDEEFQLLHRIGGESAKYRQLKRQQRVLIEKHGYFYLNSDYSSTMYADIYTEMEAALGRMGDSKLSETYALWRHEHEVREEEMLENIHRHCSGTFQRGVFLVGAAHRKYLIQKLQERAPIDPYPVAWEFPEFRS